MRTTITLAFEDNTPAVDAISALRHLADSAEDLPASFSPGSSGPLYRTVGTDRHFVGRYTITEEATHADDPEPVPAPPIGDLREHPVADDEALFDTLRNLGEET